MGIPWDDGMRWDRRKLPWDGIGTEKSVPWTSPGLRCSIGFLGFSVAPYNTPESHYSGGLQRIAIRPGGLRVDASPWNGLLRLSRSRMASGR